MIWSLKTLAKYTFDSKQTYIFKKSMKNQVGKF